MATHAEVIQQRHPKAPKACPCCGASAKPKDPKTEPKAELWFDLDTLECRFCGTNIMTGVVPTPDHEPKKRKAADK